MAQPYEFTLDYKIFKGYPVMIYTKGDAEATPMIITLTDRNIAENLTNKYVTVTIKRPDNQSFVYIANIVAQNKISFTPNLQALNTQGIVLANIQVYEGNIRVSTTRFQYLVAGELINGELVEDDSNFPVLTNLIDDVNKAKEGIGVIGSLSEDLTEKIEEAETIDGTLASRISTGNTLKNSLDADIATGSTLHTNLNADIAAANTAKSNLDGSITTAGTTKSELDASNTTANTTKTALENTISDADTAKEDLQIVIATADTTTYATKGEINDVNSQLAEKANQSYTDNQLALKRDKSVPMELEDFSATVLGAIDGTGGPFNLLSIPQDSSVTPEKTTYLTVGRNKFNKYRMLLGNLINTTGGLTVSSGYATTLDYIPVKAGEVWTFKRVRYIAFYDSDKVFINRIDRAGSSAENTETIANDGFVRITTYNGTSSNFWIELAYMAKENSYSGYESYKMGSASLEVDNSNLKNSNINAEKLAGDIPAEKVSFVLIGINKTNKIKHSLGYIVSETDGNITVNASYNTTEYIPVKAGITYVANYPRKIALYDNNKLFLSGIDVPIIIATTFTPSVDGFVRIAYSSSRSDFQIEIGSTPTSYVPYSYVMDNLEFNNDQKQKIKEFIALKIYKVGNLYKIRSVFDDVNDMVIEVSSNGSLNGSFRFERSYLIPVSSENFSNIEVFHPNSQDDITPIRTFYTVGANHGYASLQINATGYTSADLGSTWTDGSTIFTMVKTTSTYVQFVSEYIVDGNGIVSAKSIVPIANLTHVSGATNTTAIPISGYTTPNLFPSINNKSVKFVLDGKEIIADGTYYGIDLQVQESYNVMDYKSLIDYAQSHIGTSYENNSVEGVVRLSINYNFKEKGSVLINHNIRILKKVSMGDCGFVQYFPIGLSGHILTRYLPNSLTNGGYNFKNIVDMTSYSSNLIFTSAYYENSNIPPHRNIDWAVNSSTSVKKVGFAFGYLPDKSSGKHAQRLINTPRAWDMRGTKKSYPIALTGLTLEPGQYFNFTAYRNYLSPNWKPNATDFYIVQDKKDVYVFIDYHQSVSFENIKLDNYIGKSISVVESENFTIVNDIVDADGVIFTIANGYGYAILKLS
jgi:hypothetical protein